MYLFATIHRKLGQLLNPYPYARSLACLFQILRRHRFLLLDVSARDIKDQYLGKGLGVLWAVIQPIFLISIYIFVFVYIFKIRLTSAGDTPMPATDMTLYIVSGIIPFFAVQNALTRAPYILIQHANLVKQVVFPIEVLPVKLLASTLLTQCICLAIMSFYILVKYGSISPLILLLPFLLLVQYIFLAGCSYILAAVTPFFRDTSDFISMLCTILMYASPIFYNVNMLPEAIQPYMYLNPLTHFLYCYRDIFYNATISYPSSWVIVTLLSVSMLAVSARIFNKLKMLLGNVL